VFLPTFKAFTLLESWDAEYTKVVCDRCVKVLALYATTSGATPDGVAIAPDHLLASKF